MKVSHLQPAWDVP